MKWWDHYLSIDVLSHDWCPESRLMSRVTIDVLSHDWCPESRLMSWVTIDVLSHDWCPKSRLMSESRLMSWVTIDVLSHDWCPESRLMSWVTISAWYRPQVWTQCLCVCFPQITLHICWSCFLSTFTPSLQLRVVCFAHISVPNLQRPWYQMISRDRVTMTVIIVTNLHFVCMLSLCACVIVFAGRSLPTYMTSFSYIWWY